MGRKKLKGFASPKMLAARVETSDVYKLESELKLNHTTLQEALNAFCVSYISGTLSVSGSHLVVKVKL
jgi:hypothetical protein